MISMVTTWLALGVLAAIVPLGRYSHVLPLAGRGLAELGLVVAFARIILIDAAVWPRDRRS